MRDGGTVPRTSRRFGVQLAVSLLSMATLVSGQKLPAGTALPVMLNSELNAKKDRVGQKIEGKTMQDVPLVSGSRIKRGSKVTGHIVEVTRAADGGSAIVIRFDELEDQGRAIRLTVSLRALAASESVFQAGLPIETSSDSESSDQWVTRQVGGEVVNRSRGAVGSNTAIVGRWSEGVWAVLTPPLQGDCPDDEGDGREQAMWVFSTSACGLYGLPNMMLAHAGRTDPVGQIRLESPKQLMIRGGSGWLLLVTGPAVH